MNTRIDTDEVQYLYFHALNRRMDLSDVDPKTPFVCGKIAALKIVTTALDTLRASEGSAIIRDRLVTALRTLAKDCDYPERWPAEVKATLRGKREIFWFYSDLLEDISNA